MEPQKVKKVFSGGNELFGCAKLSLKLLVVEGLTFYKGCPYIVDMPKRRCLANLLEEETGGV